ncbi:MAG: hypothetical protein FWE91_08910 [Defluviitaleaceae bacterium]|nr:hypothetical protein [Defluviitaleaceae bacterium]MCL2836050.1 hypothetical protein [Defluviitaleaceae bacterium]
MNNNTIPPLQIPGVLTNNTSNHFPGVKPLTNEIEGPDPSGRFGSAAVIDISSEAFRLAQENGSGAIKFNFPQTTIRVVNYSIQMMQAMRSSSMTIPSAHISNLEENMRNLANAFETVREEVSGNSNKHWNFLEDAFRDIARMHFERAAVFNAQGEWHSNNAPSSQMSAEQMAFQAQAGAEGRRQADLFADAFLSNFRAHGAEGAFNIAWV